MTRDPATGRFVKTAKGIIRDAYARLGANRPGLPDRLDDLSGTMRVGGGVQDEMADLMAHLIPPGSMLRYRPERDETHTEAVLRTLSSLRAERSRILDAAVRNVVLSLNYDHSVVFGWWRGGLMPMERSPNANAIRAEFQRLWTLR